jgi:Type II secretion system (T2SS), protein N
MRVRPLVVAAVATLIISLIAHLPATLLVPEDQPGPLILDQVQGSWRSGSGALLVPHPAPDLSLVWELAPGYLLLGRLRYAVAARGDGLVASGHSSLSPTGTLTVESLSFDWQADEMPLIGRLPGQASFNASLVDGHLALDRDRVQAAQGLLQLSGLRAESFGQEIWLGDFSAALQVVDGVLKLPVVSGDAALQVSGDLFVSLQGRIWGVLIVRPDANTADSIVIGISAIGRPLSDGRYSIDIDLQL